MLHNVCGMTISCFSKSKTINKKAKHKNIAENTKDYKKITTKPKQECQHTEKTTTHRGKLTPQDNHQSKNAIKQEFHD